jgi:hypothetical protein
LSGLGICARELRDEDWWRRAHEVYHVQSRGCGYPKTDHLEGEHLSGSHWAMAVPTTGNRVAFPRPNRTIHLRCIQNQILPNDCKLEPIVCQGAHHSSVAAARA